MLESNYDKHPNHEMLVFDDLLPAYFSLLPKNLSDVQSGTESIRIIFNIGLHAFDLMMRHQKMKKFLKEDRHYNLVIVESFATEAFYGFGEHFQAPIIGLSTTIATGWLNLAVGNFEPWSSVPNQFLHVHPEMTFNDRFNNLLLNIYEYLYLTQYLIPESDRLIKQHLPDNKKSLQQVIKNDVCLGFVNDHFTLSLARSKSPNMIEIGGIHLPAKEDLPQLEGEFKAFLDSSDAGVIIFSLGSILRASELKKADRDIFIKVFSKLKEKIVWRYDLPDADKLPKNVLGRPWIPQAELLAHPNVKLFISHGGMLGTTEAVYNGVPVLGIPFFGDQHVNIARGVHRGYARMLKRRNITEDNLNDALQELLNNPKYKKNAQRFSDAFQDKPMTPQETVVYWSEYVIRHNCADFMKVWSTKMDVIEYNNLDVWLCVIIMIACIVSLVVLLIRVIASALMHMKDKIKTD